ncbi:acyltransferase domain-containing protein [Streptomyces sp. INA 01156]
MLPGQGSQFASMGVALYESDARFRKALDDFFDAFGTGAGRLRSEWLHGSAQDIGRGSFAQPLLFGLDYAAGVVWLEELKDVDVTLIGHSVGELAAATLAGAFDLELAGALLNKRAQLLDAAPRGGMIACRATEDALREHLDELDGRAVIAAENADNQCVVSCAEEDLPDTMHHLGSRHVTCMRVASTEPFHSPCSPPPPRSSRSSWLSAVISCPRRRCPWSRPTRPGESATRRSCPPRSGRGRWPRRCVSGRRSAATATPDRTRSWKSAGNRPLHGRTPTAFRSVPDFHRGRHAAASPARGGTVGIGQAQSHGLVLLTLALLDRRKAIGALRVTRRAPMALSVKDSTKRPSISGRRRAPSRHPGDTQDLGRSQIRTDEKIRTGTETGCYPAIALDGGGFQVQDPVGRTAVNFRGGSAGRAEQRHENAECFCRRTGDGGISVIDRSDTRRHLARRSPSTFHDLFASARRSCRVHRACADKG